MSNLFCTNYGRDWKTISHRLSNRHNIRNNTIIFKCPKILTKTPKSCLNLISDRYHTFCFQFFVYPFVKILGRDNLTGAALHKLAYKSASVFINQGINILSIVLTRFLAARKKSTVGTGTFSHCYMRSLFCKLVPLIWTDFLTGFGNPMVSIL